LFRLFSVTLLLAARVYGADPPREDARMVDLNVVAENSSRIYLRALPTWRYSVKFIVVEELDVVDVKSALDPIFPCTAPRFGQTGGVYADDLKPGHIRRGDSVTVSD